MNEVDLARRFIDYAKARGASKREILEGLGDLAIACYNARLWLEIWKAENMKGEG